MPVPRWLLRVRPLTGAVLAGIFLDGGKSEVGGTDDGGAVGRGRGGGSVGLVPGFSAC